MVNSVSSKTYTVLQRETIKLHSINKRTVWIPQWSESIHEYVKLACANVGCGNEQLKDY